MQLNHEKYNAAVRGEISLRLFTPFDAFSPIITTISTFYPLKEDRATIFPKISRREPSATFVRQIVVETIIPTASSSTPSVGVARPQVQNEHFVIVSVSCLWLRR